jgi:hypothetical protein
MPLVNRLDAVHASAAPLSHASKDPEFGDSDQFEMTDFEAELRRLSAANQELLGEFHHGDDVPAAAGADAEELEALRHENAELKSRIHELEALVSGQGEDVWLERQREYEMLLEEKSEVIRSLHQKLHEAQEPADTAEAPVLSAGGGAPMAGQAAEILRLKRELDEQRRQLEQDEKDMMAQMRQMEIAMAKERAEMARQRQEVRRQQSDLAREIEQSGRDPELRERLNTLRRQSDPKLRPPTEEAPPAEQQSSGFFRRMFG